MKTKKACIVILSFLTYNLIFSQEVKFGNISKAELEEEFNPIDSSAVATYLYKYRKTFFEYRPESGFRLVTRIHERIKIYNQDGFDYASKNVQLYKYGNNQEKLSGLKAITYNLKNGKIEENKLKKDGEFEVSLSEYRNQSSFTMPNISEGSVVEYKFEVQSPFISNIDEFIFQHDIPVKKLVAIMDSPEYFNFRMNSKGFLNVNPKNSSENRKLLIKERVDNRVGLSYEGPGGARSNVQTSNIEYTSNIVTYEMTNIPALREEPYVNGIQNYRSGVTYELSYTKFPNKPIKTYATNWEAVVKSIYERGDFGSELMKTGYYAKDIDALLLGIGDSEEKIAAILNHVKSKVRWDEYYGKYTNSGVKKAYKEGVGNVAEINLMLTSMLRYAGLDANPILVSTRANGIPLFPTREGYNYVISGVRLPDGLVLLDATDVYSTPNVLPFRALNWEGRTIRKDGTSETVSLYPVRRSQKKVVTNLELTASGAIRGKIQISYKDHDATSFRKSYFKTNEEDYLVGLEEKYGDMEIDDFKAKNADVLLKSPNISYSYTLDNASDVVSDKIYFIPMFFLKTTKNPFTLENREFPIDFGYPSSKSIVLTITLPEGYSIESLPESMSLALPEGIGIFKFMIQDTDSTIQLRVISQINTAVVPAFYYDSLKEYYKKMIEKMNEKVVLSKD